MPETATVESLTVELGSARDISAAIEHLLSGQEEVERLLKGRRASGD